MMGSTNRNDFSGAQMRSPTTGCSRMSFHSCSLSFPGFNRIASGTAIFPTSFEENEGEDEQQSAPGGLIIEEADFDGSGGEEVETRVATFASSVQTTERYLGCKQNLGHPGNDLFDLGTDGQAQEMKSESVARDGPR